MEFRSSVPHSRSFIPENYCLSQVLQNRKKNLGLYKLMEVSFRPPPIRLGLAPFPVRHSTTHPNSPSGYKYPSSAGDVFSGTLGSSFRQTPIHRHLRLQANQITRIYDISVAYQDQYPIISVLFRLPFTIWLGRPAFEASAFLQLKWYCSTENHISSCL